MLSIFQVICHVECDSHSSSCLLACSVVERALLSDAPFAKRVGARRYRDADASRDYFHLPTRSITTLHHCSSIVVVLLLMSSLYLWLTLLSHSYNLTEAGLASPDCAVELHRYAPYLVDAS